MCFEEASKKRGHSLRCHVFRGVAYRYAPRALFEMAPSYLNAIEISVIVTRGSE